MSSSNLVRIGYKKEATYGVTPSAVKASKAIQDITYTAKLGGTNGNNISVEYTTGATAGSEVVTVTGNAIVVQIEDQQSTATQVKAALDNSSDFLALATAEITGTAETAQEEQMETNLEGGSGEFKTARFTSEQYSGTPETTESAQIRTDRMSSGQVVTGLTVEGGHNFELAKEEALEDFFESAMFNEWETHTEVSATLTFTLSTKKLTRSSGSFTDEGVIVGDFIKLKDFTKTNNNVIAMVTSVSGLELVLAIPAGMEDEGPVSAKYQICDKLTIGTTKKSLTVEKTFLDLTDKAIIYRGQLVNQMELSVEYGSLITGSFQTMGNSYEPVDEASNFASYEESFKDPATTNTMNGSVDMPFIATNVTGVWGQDSFCLQNLNLTLNNNLTVQNCIGKAAPEDYSPGNAQITTELSSYLKDGNWDMLERKLTQEAFAIGYMVANPDGWYGFYLPAIQVSFDDPQSGGANQEISMDMSGMAKVGPNGESQLTIYREPTTV